MVPATSSSDNASATAFACFASRTTRFAYARMATIIVRTVETPVIFARRNERPAGSASRKSGLGEPELGQQLLFSESSENSVRTSQRPQTFARRPRCLLNIPSVAERRVGSPSQTPPEVPSNPRGDGIFWAWSTGELPSGQAAGLRPPELRKTEHCVS